LFLSKDTATSRPDNVADKTLFSTGALFLFSEFSCFLLLDESVLSEVSFGASLLGTSCLFSGTACPLGASFLSVSFTDSFLSSAFPGSLFSFLFSVTFSSFGATFLVSSFADSLFSFLSLVTFSSFVFSISTEELLFKEFSKIAFTF